jgi:hypothetical protein
MTTNANIGQAFPLESLGSDIARSEYNYQSILNALVEWNSTESDQVIVRLTKDTDPFFQDYVIPSKKAATESNVNTLNATGVVSADSVDDATLNISLYGGSQYTDGVKWYVDNEDPGDLSTIRVTVNNSGGNEWQLHYKPLVAPWDAASRFRYGNYVSYNSDYYKLSNNVESKPILKQYYIEQTTGTEATIYNDAHGLLSGDIINIVGSTYFDGAYTINTVTADSINITATSSIVAQPQITKIYEVDQVATATSVGHTLAVDDFISISSSTYYNGTYKVTGINGGDFTFTVNSNYPTDNGLFDLSIVDVAGEIDSPNLSPDLDINSYTLVTDPLDVDYQVVPVTNTFSSSVVYKWITDVDVESFKLKNVTDIDSSSTTDIKVNITFKQKQFESIYQKSVKVFNTTNYRTYPYDKAAMWLDNTTYTTNNTINVEKRQTYTASMIFNHVDQSVGSTVNFVNYEGPDLENGLSVYLPVEIDLGNGQYALPEDGYTMDFYFRIWPNTKYTNAVTRDHIINKSQIHVHSCDNLNDALTDDCKNLIAKFSMARMTNTYISGENISIPDKPVIYRATFVYSSTERNWVTMDYYQLPDHVFMGPVGYVDPQNPGNQDISPDMSDINPNAKFVGYETGAFPTFTDIFSDNALNPMRLSEDDLNEFTNRIS